MTHRGVKVELERIEPLLFGDAEEAAMELQPARVVHQAVNFRIAR